MALIQTDPSDPTTEQKQALTKDALARLVTNAFEHLKNVYFQGYSLVNKNDFGLTPDEVAAGLGDDAAELTRLADLLKTTITTAVPGTVLDPPDDSPIDGAQ